MPKPSRSVLPIAAAALGSLAVIGFLIWGATRPDKNVAESDPPPEVSRKVVPPTVAPPVITSSLPEGYAMVGGVPRPKSDVQPASKSPSGKVPPKKRQGFSPALSPADNPQIAAVHDALKGQREHPERFSSFVVPHNFDEAAFKASPAKYAQQYASVVEPGRVFAPAQPGEDVAVIRPESRRYHRVKQGETVRLSVEASPGAPVTFTSQDLGQFENQLTSVTVVANTEGLASASYTASGGTIDEVQILAASPITSGQVAFTVSVKVDG